MIVKPQTEHDLEFLSLKGGCRGSSESTLVKMSNCWQSHAAAHFLPLTKQLLKQCHVTLGFGCPVTWQVNSTESPAFQDPDATATDVIFGAKNRRSYMSAPVLLHVLKKLRKKKR